MRISKIIPVIACALLLSACNAGNSVSSTPAVAPTVTQSVPITGQSANTAFPVSLNTAVAQAAGVSAATFTLPVSLPANTTVTANSGQPANVLTPFSTKERTVSAFRTTQSTSIPNASALLFFVFNTPSNVAVSGNYQFAFTLSSTPSSAANYYVSVFDGQEWRANATGSSAVVSGNTLTFSGTFPSGLVVGANTSYAFALYSLPKTTTGVYTTSTSGTSPSVIGLIDGAVTLAPPLSTTAVNIDYTSTINAPSGIPNLASISGVTQVPGYIIITPESDVTFAAGQTITISHPADQQNGSNNASGQSGNATGSTGQNGTAGNGTTATGQTGANGTSAGNSNNNTGGNNNNNNGPPHIAIYDPSSASPAWILGGGMYSTDGVTQQLTQTLTSAITLKAGVTYYFGVYMMAQ